MSQSLSQPALETAPVLAGGTNHLVLASWTLWRREMVRFFRQRNRVVGALATPLVFWLLLGSGLNRSFTLPGAPTDSVGYLEYFFPGTMVLVLLFTAIFSTISVIEDRREGFLQAVLVAPIPRLAIVLGKVLGGASIATIQGVIYLALWPLVGAWPGWGAMIGAIGVMFLLATGLTALGLLLAWPMDSTAGFHAVMNLLLMPMWFLCGAVFPIESAPLWMRTIMYFNPLTYGQSAFTATLIGHSGGASGWGQSPRGLGIDLALTAAFTLVAVLAAAWLVTRPRREGV